MKYPFTSLTIFPLLRLFVRKTIGFENLPKPPFILAANHDSYLDPMLIIAVVVPKVDKQVHYLAMKGRFWDFFGDKIARNWAGCVPLDEGKEKALKELMRLLRKGDVVGIFPGGPRSPDGNLTKGKTGAVRMALAAHCPVVPVGLIGTYDISPRDQIIPRLKRCEMRFGKPIYFNKYYNKKITNGTLHTLTHNLMKEIAKLINKKYLYKEIELSRL